MRQLNVKLREPTPDYMTFEGGLDLVTPPIECGLLAGTYRDHLLEEGEIEERVIGLDDLRRCQGLFLINSVRRWQSADAVAGYLPTELSIR